MAAPSISEHPTDASAETESYQLPRIPAPSAMPSGPVSDQTIEDMEMLQQGFRAALHLDESGYEGTGPSAVPAFSSSAAPSTSPKSSAEPPAQQPLSSESLGPPPRAAHSMTFDLKFDSDDDDDTAETYESTVAAEQDAFFAAELKKITPDFNPLLWPKWKNDFRAQYGTPGRRTLRAAEVLFLKALNNSGMNGGYLRESPGFCPYPDSTPL